MHIPSISDRSLGEGAHHGNTVTSIYTEPDGLLESPCWDGDNSWVWLVSINACRVMAVNLSGHVCVNHRTSAEVSFVQTLDRSHVLYADATGIYRLNHVTGSTTQLYVSKLPAGFRFNDATQDAKGRILIGIKVICDTDDRLGCLISVDSSGYSSVLLDAIKIPNGLAFNQEMTTLYFCESSSHIIYKYDYNLKSGTLGDNPVELIEFPNDVYPDGICLDSSSHLWVAEWNGSCVSRWDTNTGMLQQKIHFPFSKISSCTLGGNNGRHLFVTSAHERCEAESSPGGAHLFVCEI